MQIFYNYGLYFRFNTVKDSSKLHLTQRKALIGIDCIISLRRNVVLSKASISVIVRITTTTFPHRTRSVKRMRHTITNGNGIFVFVCLCRLNDECGTFHSVVQMKPLKVCTRHKTEFAFS